MIYENVFRKSLIDSSEKVFKTMVFADLEVGTISHEDLVEFTQPYTMILDLSGVGPKGEVYTAYAALSFSSETYLQVANSMLMEEEEQISDENSDVGLELINMIVGNSKEELEQLGYSLPMASPQMHKSATVLSHFGSCLSSTQITFKSRFGEVFLSLLFK